MPQDLLDRYEDIMHDLLGWIQEKTWGGHEKGCPAFAGACGECNCIASKVEKAYSIMHEREIANAR